MNLTIMKRNLLVIKKKKVGFFYVFLKYWKEIDSILTYVYVENLKKN